ncbi:peptidoglycan-recognition protein SC2-like isoform X2 [Homarus americanus]|uniref:peptidoglycan-recognition protein SC2-like isoform X2 n=1 Tax=Homarus americanus TaxID=6706 RepID=UPI001C491315|nr:peptidoglycan-recognition protein SC2-like isoform X2 [Homarus americanus]
MLKMYAVIAVGLVVLHQGQCQPVPGCCYCVDDSGNNVTAFWSACTEEHKDHTVGACFEATGYKESCSPKRVTYEVTYGPRTAWITSEHLQASASSKCAGMGGDCSRLQFVTRAEWGARDPVSREPIIPPFSGVFVHHSAMARCNTSEECVAEVQEIQKLHMDKNGWDDIGYHFLVGEDGRVYEGRGWNARGAHARAHNAWTYGICVMGNYVMALPNDRALTALRDIMDCGVKQGKITQGFEVFGHRDGVCTECPGQMLYEEIQTWPYYSHRTIPIYC